MRWLSLHPTSTGGPAPSASTHLGPSHTGHSPTMSHPNKHTPTRPQASPEVIWPHHRLLPTMGPTCVPRSSSVWVLFEKPPRALLSSCRRFPFYLIPALPNLPSTFCFIFGFIFQQCGSEYRTHLSYHFLAESIHAADYVGDTLGKPSLAVCCSRKAIFFMNSNVSQALAPLGFVNS